MLQAFYWDSYEDTQWTKLQSQADVISRSFNSIWVPQSGYCNTGSNGKSMGYNPVWWFNQNSSFGKQEELKQMIATFNAKNVAVIEDVVINHKSGDKDWCDFPEEEWNGKKLEWSLADICRDDEAKDKFNVSLNPAVFFLVRKFYMLRCLFGVLYVDMRCFGVSWVFSKHKIPHPNQWGSMKSHKK